MSARCEHPIWERDTAATADGQCPLCLGATLAAVTKERDEAVKDWLAEKLALSAALLRAEEAERERDEALDGLAHMERCRECGEGPWEDLAGAKALLLLNERRRRLALAAPASPPGDKP